MEKERKTAIIILKELTKLLFEDRKTPKLDIFEYNNPEKYFYYKCEGTVIDIIKAMEL